MPEALNPPPAARDLATAARKKVSVVVPVYYNEQSLPDLYAELRKLEQIWIP